MKNIPRIGFACKLSQLSERGQVESIPEYNTRTTTCRWLGSQSRATAEERLWDLMKHNIESCRQLVKYIGEQDVHLRMVRLSSDILPVYTEPTWRYFWQLPSVRDYAQRHFAEVGRIARDKDVRLSFHPGQFTVLASDNPDIVTRSIEEFEYHVAMAEMMGYGLEFQDFKINIHISGRRGVEGMRESIQRLSQAGRRMITVENDEITWGLDHCLELADDCAVVLDIHHHFIKTGEYIQPDDPRWNTVLQSWRGRRPVIHYSVSRESDLPNHDPQQLLNRQQLLESGHKISRLRAHSDYYWNHAVNQWAATFSPQADIMCESKAKNLASFDFYNRYVRA